MAARAPAMIIIRPAVNVAGHLRGPSDYGDLLRTLGAHRIDVRYRQTLLGVSWAVLQPLLMMTIFSFVFSTLARIPTGRTTRRVEPGRAVRGDFYTPRDWRLVTEHAQGGRHSPHA